MAYEDLIKKAKEAMKFSYAPYSKLRVGAALLSSSGEIVLGANYECSSYGLTMCAERNVIFNANARGIKDIEAIAITSSKGRVSPCGACRQIMFEAAQRCKKDIVVIMADDKGSEERRISELLPYPFSTFE
jgi:cytidine deaminase, homotetrameric